MKKKNNCNWKFKITKKAIKNLIRKISNCVNK